MSARRVLVLALVLLTSSAAPAFAAPGWQGGQPYTIPYDRPVDARFFADASGNGLLGIQLRDDATGYDQLMAFKEGPYGFASLGFIYPAVTPIESWDMTLQSNPDQPVAVAWSTPSPSYSVKMAVYDVSDGDWSTYTLATSTNQITGVRVFPAANETLTVWINYTAPYSLESRMRNSIGALGTHDRFDLTSDAIGGFSGGASAAGIVTVVWDQVWGGPKEVVGRSYHPGLGWQAFTSATVGAPEWTNSTPLAVVDPGGNVTAFFLQVNGSTTSWLSTTFNASSTFTQPVEVIESIPAVYLGKMMLRYRDGAGVAAAWQAQFAGELEVHTAVRPQGGPWGSVREVTTPEGSWSWRDFSMNGSGDAAFAWTTGNGSFYDLLISRMSASGAARRFEAVPLVYGSPVEIGFIKVFARPSGNITVGWLEFRGVRNEFVMRTFTPDDMPPALSVSTPATGAVVTVPTAVISGVTEPGATLTVGSLSVAVAGDGSFAVPYALVNGSNTIEVKAADAFGNEASSTVNITFDDPTAALAAQLALLEARLAAIDGGPSSNDTNVSSLRAELANASANLSLARADLAAASAAVQTAQGDLTEARAKLNASAANITALEGTVQSLTARINTLDGGTPGAPRPTDNTLALLAVVLAAVAAVLAAMALLRGRGGKPARAPTPSLEPLPPEAPPPKERAE